MVFKIAQKSIYIWATFVTKIFAENFKKIAQFGYSSPNNVNSLDNWVRLVSKYIKPTIVNSRDFTS